MMLTAEQRKVLEGGRGRATRKAMEILHALGTIYGAEELIPISSVQIAGVSYANLGEAGLHFLAEMAEGGGKAQVLTTLNPAGMDIENWQALGISEDFARQQMRVLDAFARMNVITTCSCTPYLFGNLPGFGEHIAWAESSAVCYANSVLGARTNREGGPSALAASLTGLTPAYGYHLEENRKPTITCVVEADLSQVTDFGALGYAIGKKIEGGPARAVPFILGVERAASEDLKSFCASIATFGGTALFHMPGFTPEADCHPAPEQTITIRQSDLDEAKRHLNNARVEEVDFISVGCPHLSIREIARAAELLEGKKVKVEFWITTARPTKSIADRNGYTQIIEDSGVKFAVDTCCVVAPIQGRFNAIATDSAKACYYAYAKNRFKTLFMPLEQIIAEVLE
jgi:predicted aconitase